jgi:hypothetical protein
MFNPGGSSTALNFDNMFANFVHNPSIVFNFSQTDEPVVVVETVPGPVKEPYKKRGRPALSDETKAANKAKRDAKKTPALSDETKAENKAKRAAAQAKKAKK